MKNLMLIGATAAALVALAAPAMAVEGGFEMHRAYYHHYYGPFEGAPGWDYGYRYRHFDSSFRRSSPGNGTIAPDYAPFN